MFRKLLGHFESSRRKSQNSGGKYIRPQSRRSTPSSHASPRARVLPWQLYDSETFYSTFHEVPQRREFSKNEWNKFTKDSTKKVSQELVASPNFNRWVVANAERITLTPKTSNNGGFWRRFNPFY